MAKLINSLAFSDSSYILTVPYATCSTEGATAAKEVTLTNWVEAANLEAGAIIAVKFNNANTAANPTLNVSGTGAKTIKYNGAPLPSTQNWLNESVVEFMYDGECWNVLGSIVDNDNDTDTDTHHTAYLYVGGAGAFANSETTNGNTYIKLFENSELRSQLKISGGGHVTVSSDDAGNITISSPVTDNVTSNKVTSGTFYIVGSSNINNISGSLKKRENVYVDSSGNIIANNIPTSGLIWNDAYYTR